MRPPGVLGLGLVGGSLLQGLAAAGTAPLGWDADERVRGAAARAGFAVAAEPQALARECDVVVVCVPPAVTATAVAGLLAADPAAVVADAASVKGPVLAAVAERVGDEGLRRYLPAHPLAGRELAGWEGADPGLLRGAPWAVCPPAHDAPPEPICALSSALEPLGGRLLVCEAVAHDEAVARTSHAPHVIAQALARAAACDGVAAALTGGAYRDMTRTATADEALWSAILRMNRGPVAAALRALGAELTALADAVEADDAPALGAAWKAGAAARERAVALRSEEPAWEPERLPWPAWGALLELGRAGRAVRRLRCADGELDLDVARA